MWKRFGFGRCNQNSFHSFTFNEFPLQLGCFRSSCWIISSATLHCKYTDRYSCSKTAAISVDRLIALVLHLRYPSVVTKSRVRCTVLTIWLIRGLSSGFYLWKRRECHLMAAVTTVICLIISTFSYIKIYLIVHHHQSQIHVQQQIIQSSSNVGHTMHVARVKKTAMNTFVFYIFLLICYFPMYILSTLHGISFVDWVTEWDFAHTAVFMNSSINPILYCWRLRELRTAVVKTLRQTFSAQTDQH